MKLKKKGFSLVEILVVMAILMIMVTITVGLFNSIGITNKGRDALRKKDLNRIKIAFEEYYNDKGFFPQDVDTWNIKANCKTGIFKPYLNPWPCDIDGNPYRIIVVANEFRVITDLENKKDKDIPAGWYESGGLDFGTTDVNYGVSSPNILWYQTITHDYSICDKNACAAFNGTNCKNVTSCTGGDNCFYYHSSGYCMGQCAITNKFESCP